MAIPTLPPPSAKAVEIGERVKAFLEEHIIPAEPVYERQLDEGGDRWQSPPIMAELKEKAKKAGLWNMFLPKKHYPDSLTNLEYASICETMGRSPIGSRAVQLLGARHRQHGDADPLRHAGAEEAVARAADGRRRSARPSR